jgi:hypothetical protein
MCLVVVVGIGACDGPPRPETEQEIQVQATCDAALAKLQGECMITIDAATLDAVTCDEGQQCAASCVEGASCEEIVVTLQGGINTFSACVDVCAGQPIRQEAPACVAAKNRLIDCGLGITGVCTEQDTCFTNCVATFSCEEMNAWVQGAADNPFGRCMQGC